MLHEQISEYLNPFRLKMHNCESQETKEKRENGGGGKRRDYVYLKMQKSCRQNE
jgi:hypothetical protein